MDHPKIHTHHSVSMPEADTYYLRTFGIYLQSAEKAEAISLVFKMRAH